MDDIYTLTFNDTLTGTYVENGGQPQPSTETLSGSLVVDYTTGQVSNADLPGSMLTYDPASDIYSITLSGNARGEAFKQTFTYTGESPYLFNTVEDYTDYFQGGTYVTDDSATYAPVTPTQGNTVCFVGGTPIRTASGDIAVETLRVGDLASTACGTLRPIRWIGSRTIAHPSFEQCPVRIRAGAFGAGLPERDLFLSPGHPVLVGADAENEGGYLVPIMCLINGTTIARHPVESVTYWHVELDAHDILLAEGLPAESYIALGSRPWFAGADGALFDPDFVLPGMPGRCRPVAVDGPAVEAERRRLDAVFAMALATQCGWDHEPVLAF